MSAKRRWADLTPGGQLRRLRRLAEAGEISVGDAVLGHHRRDVGMVMLHLDDGEIVVLRPLRRQVPGVEIGSNRLRFNPEEINEVVNGTSEGVESLEVLHVPDVLAHEPVAARSEAERSLQLTTGREDGRHLEGQRDRERRVASGTPDRIFGAVEHAHHRVITRGGDVATVNHEGVGERIETVDCLIVRAGDRFLGQVARCHHPDVAGRNEEVVEWCVGEHDSDVPVAGSDEVGNHRVRTLRKQDDWSFPGCEEAGLVGAYLRNRPCGCEIGDHHRKRSVNSALALPQKCDCRIRGRIATEVEPPEAFDGNDLTGGDASTGIVNRIG